MAKLLKLRRGSTSQHSSFTGAEGEVTVDTDKETLVVHNGSTAGGFPVARADGTGTTNFTITGELDAATLDISGNADIDGTLEADAYTVNGTALDTHIAGVTVTNATNAAHVSVADNESTNENNKIVFIEDAGATGNVGLESDGDLYYNPSTGIISVPAVTTTSNVIVGGNLTVNGTTTTINSTTLAVDDKNIVLGDVSSPDDSTANGGGITLKGAADIEWKWVSSTGAWTSTEGVHLPDGEILRLGTDSDLRLYHNGTVGTIDNQTGDIHLKTTGSGDDILLDSIDDIYLRVDGTESGIEIIGGGAVNIYHHNVKKFETTSAGVTVSGTVTDSKGDVRKIPLNFHNAGTYTLVASDAGKVVSEATNGANITVPASVFLGGDAVTIMNHNGGNTTITQGSGVTLYNAADGTTGNRTLAARGFCTIFFREHNVAYISGAGLS